MTEFDEHTHRPKPTLLAFAHWSALGVVVGVAAGGASALFLVWLDWATRLRGRSDGLVYALPFAGLFIGAILMRYGRAIRGGSDLVIDRIHDGGPEIPLRMAPMVMVGTVLTHLFGGSAGREGTAVQMGASLADFVSHRLRIDRETRRMLLAAGAAGGFGSVFGTPFAGLVFGLEFVSVGRVDLKAMVPALFASVVGDMTTRALGVGHTRFPELAEVALSPELLLKWVVFGAAIALVVLLFIETTKRLRRLLESKIPSLPLRMFAGGVAVVLLYTAVGTDDYLGLGVPTIERAFVDPSLPIEAFALKLVFTAVTLSAGFLGGEVTPLFFIGATLGSVLARGLDVPLALGAGVGMAAAFAAASNAPLALSVMAAELLGANVFPHVIVVIAIAYVLSGHRGIYPAQRVGAPRAGRADPRPRSVARATRPSGPPRAS